MTRLRVRVPLELALVLVLLALLAGLGVELAWDEVDATRRALLLVGVALDAVLMWGLAMMRKWALWVGGFAFATNALWLLTRSLVGELDARGAVVVAASVFVSAYLLSPTTRRMATIAARPRWDASSLLPLVVLAYLPSVGMLALALEVGAAEWFATLLAMAAGSPYFLLGQRLQARVRDPLVGRPGDLDRSQSARFGSARRAFRDGRLERVDELLDDDEPPRSVRILKARVEMERARDRGGLAAVVWFASPPGVGISDDARVLREARSTDLVALVGRRVQLIDDLIADATAERPAFADETKYLLETVLGVRLRMNDIICAHDEWAYERPLVSGDRALDWLARRLWSMTLLDSACEVARRGADSKLTACIEQTAACVAALREQRAWRADRTAERWHRVIEAAPDLCLVPSSAEALDLLSLEGPLVSAHSAAMVAERMRVGLLRLLEAEELRLEPAAETGATSLLVLLTGYVPRRRFGAATFDRWWRRRRSDHISFATQVAHGLDAVAAERWSDAADAFARAHALQPERASVAHNQIVALLMDDRADDGERVARLLVTRDAADASGWVYLGDCQRAQGARSDAIVSYRKAVELVGMGTKVATRLGFALAESGQLDEANTLFLAAVGPDADADRLDGLARFLAEKGHLELAERQRAVAQFMRMGQVEDDGPLDEASSAGAPSVH